MAHVKVIEENDELTHIGLSGRLDEDGVQVVELRFTTHVRARRRPTLVNLSEVEFIDSHGMDMLLHTARAIEGHGVGTVLVAPSGPVAETLRSGAFDQLIPIADDPESALALMEKPDGP